MYWSGFDLKGIVGTALFFVLSHCPTQNRMHFCWKCSMLHSTPVLEKRHFWYTTTEISLQTGGVSYKCAEFLCRVFLLIV